MRARARPVVLLVLASTIAAVLSCRQIVGIESEPQGRAPACGVPFAGACRACAEGACCAEANACAASTACSAFYACVQACDRDTACRARCTADHPPGTDPDVPPLDRCLATRCNDACGPACSWVADYAEPDAASSCRDCALANVCDAVASCLGDLECIRIVRCQRSVHEPDRASACDDGHDAGFPLMRRAVDEIRSSCLYECQLGTNWSCVGKLTWPVSRTSNVAIHIRLLDIQSPQRPRGITAKLCTPYDASCASPLDVQTTDAEGRAVLTRSVGQGGLGPTGYVELSAPDKSMVPMLFFWTFPLSAPDVDFGLEIPTVPVSAFAQIADALSAKVDPSRGHVLMDAFDCGIANAPGVRFTASTADAASSSFYLRGGALFVPATNDIATDGTGTGFFLNVPSGAVALEATPVSLGRRSAITTVFVRPGTISFVLMPVTP